MKRIILIIFIINFSCADKQENQDVEHKTLFIADCLKDLNKNIALDCKSNLDTYWLDKEDRGKDSTKTKQYYFGIDWFIQKEIVDSLYKTIPLILMQNSEQAKADTAVYISYPNFVAKDIYLNSSVKKSLKIIVDNLTHIQDTLRQIQIKIEKTRVGPKKEKIICQLARQNIFFTDIDKSNSNAELFLETEKQFNIIYRELECTLFSIEFVHKWKSANNYYKVRI